MRDNAPAADLTMGRLVAQAAPTHKPPVSRDLFDRELRALRRDRAFRNGPELFLLDRAFEDLLDRLSFVQRDFRSALLIGCPDPEWMERLQAVAQSVTATDPGSLFAEAADAHHIDEEQLDLPDAAFDLCVTIGTLDTVNDLPGALRSIRQSLSGDALLIGAMSGGETLPRLRSAMRAADVLQGVAAPHIHPRIEAPSLAMLLSSAGFVMPVVDVDRIEVGYRSLRRLVSDLRAMGATNILTSRPRQPLSRAAREAAEVDFMKDSQGGRAVETFEILNFAVWTPSAPPNTA
jgi:NADH dehydrogenase [ubiquinone] 1 alpha subcomplex assembly factor 5